MVWPPGVRGLLVTEAVRGEGGILRNKEAERFMWRYLPEDRRHEYAETDEEASRWVEALSEGRTTDARMPPELSTRDNVARAIYTEVREGRGLGTAASSWTSATWRRTTFAASCRPCTSSSRSWPSSDITAGPMEVGPTCHYVMGGVRVDPETAASSVPGLYAAGEVAGGMHGANRLGGNSLSDLLVFGRRAGRRRRRSPRSRAPHRSWMRGSSARRRESCSALRPQWRRGPVSAPPICRS